MGAIQLLKQQHREAERLIDLLLKDESRRDELLAQLGRALLLHNALEEALVYVAANTVDMELLSAKAETEHTLVEGLVAELTAGDLGQLEFTARLLVLKELVLRHADTEEKEFLPRLESRLGVKRLELLGAALEDRLEELDATEVEPRVSEPEPVVTLADDVSSGHA